MRRRTPALIAASVSASAALVTGGILVTTRPSPPSEASSIAHQVKTGSAPVVRGDLSGTKTVFGRLEGTPGPTIRAGVAGTLTLLPASGSVVKPRGELARIDDQPVTFLTGALPQWRAFEDGMSDGPDVRQLEENLHAWGYLRERPTAHFDWHTRVAIRAWQKATGQPQTGRIDFGRVWFGKNEFVVSERKAAVGDPVGAEAPLYDSVGTEKIVTVDLPMGSPLAKVGGVVEVELPGGVRAKGKVTSLGDPVTDEQNDKTTVPTTVSFDDPKAVGSFSRLDVSAEFVSETRKDVLSVPVTALGATSGGGFVVEVVGSAGATRRVPVKVGLFAGDRVEITSGAVRAGDRVVVPV